VIIDDTIIIDDHLYLSHLDVIEVVLRIVIPKTI
jgi:hypothetical protein